MHRGGRTVEAADRASESCSPSHLPRHTLCLSDPGAHLERIMTRDAQCSPLPIGGACTGTRRLALGMRVSSNCARDPQWRRVRVRVAPTRPRHGIRFQIPPSLQGPIPTPAAPCFEFSTPGMFSPPDFKSQYQYRHQSRLHPAGQVAPSALAAARGARPPTSARGYRVAWSGCAVRGRAFAEDAVALLRDMLPGGKRVRSLELARPQGARVGRFDTK